MSGFNIARNVCKSKKYLRATNLGGWTSTRTTTVVSDAERSELATAKPFSEIPSIASFPLIGSAWLYFPFIGRYSLQKLHKADEDKHKKYGDIVKESFGTLDVVSVFTPESQEVMAKHEGKYPTRGEIMSMKKYRELRKEWYSSTGVMILQGQEWWDLRAKTQKHLMKPRTIQAYLEPMQDVARDLVKRIYEKRDKNMEVDGFLEDLYKWALESVAYVGLDTRMGCLSGNLSPDSDGMKLIKSVQTQFECMNNLEPITGNFPFWKYLPSPTWKKFVKASDDFTEIAFKYINRAIEDLKKLTGEDRDLTMLQQMLLTKDLDSSGIMVMVADMLFAGVDTTSHSVGFTLYHLAKNPEKKKILAEEVKTLLPNKEDRITPQIFSQLHYLKACMKESIRLTPITRGNARIFDHDVVIHGYRIPAGTTVFCILQQVSKKAEYFKDPETFRPERWLNKEEKLSNPFAYVPFGFGVRSCIGRRLAELEMICALTEIVRNFDVEYHHEDIDMLTRMVNIPDRPLRFNFLDQ